MNGGFILWVSTLLACTGTKGGGDSGAPDGGTDGGTDGGVDGGADGGADGGSPAVVEPPCADGTWGFIDPDAPAIHVSDAAAAGGDGSPEAPFDALDSALAAAAESGLDRIALWPGTYSGRLIFESDQSGFVLHGCSAAEVWVRSSDSELPGLLVSGATGVDLAGFTVDGGALGIWFKSDGSGRVEGVMVEDADLAGIVIDGSEKLAVVDLVDMGIRASGFGLVVGGGTVTVDGLGVQDSDTVGVLVHGSDAVVELRDLVVQEVAPVDGRFGRGIQVQEFARVTITGDSLVRDVSDAGLFVHFASVMVEGLEIELVAANDLEGGSSGDGVVLSAYEEGASYDPLDFPSSLAGLAVSGFVRAGIYVENVEGQLDGNTVTKGSAACSICYLEGSPVAGSDIEGGEASPVTEAMVLDRAPIDVSGLEIGIE